MPQLKTALKAIGPGVAIGRARRWTMSSRASVAEPRFRTLLLRIFAVVSLVLAAVGLYGVVAFSVSQRRAELGLRIALGADPGEVLAWCCVKECRRSSPASSSGSAARRSWPA